MNQEIIPNKAAGSALVVGFEPSRLVDIIRALRGDGQVAIFDFKPQVRGVCSDPRAGGLPDAIEIRGLYGNEETIANMAHQVIVFARVDQKQIYE